MGPGRERKYAGEKKEESIAVESWRQDSRTLHAFVFFCFVFESPSPWFTSPHLRRCKRSECSQDVGAVGSQRDYIRNIGAIYVRRRWWWNFSDSRHWFKFVALYFYTDFVGNCLRRNFLLWYQVLWRSIQ